MPAENLSLVLINFATSLISEALNSSLKPWTTQSRKMFKVDRRIYRIPKRNEILRLILRFKYISIRYIKIKSLNSIISLLH